MIIYDFSNFLWVMKFHQERWKTAFNVLHLRKTLDVTTDYNY